MPSDTWPPDVHLPTQDELPCDDGVPMESGRHRQQMILLIQTLQPWLAVRGDGFVGGNMFVYFSPSQLRGEDVRGPDCFVALGVPPGERKSWVVWEEGKPPDVVIELLSPATAEQDRTTKLRLYRDRLRVPEYYWYDPFDPADWAGFQRLSGRYQPIAADSRGNLPSPLLGLCLTRWRGRYEGVEATWLRWTTPDGALLPTGDERAEAAEAELQRLRALLARGDGEDTP